jgi:hypothetical protein
MLFFEFTRSEGMAEDQLREMNRAAIDSILCLAIPDLFQGKEGADG